MDSNITFFDYLGMHLKYFDRIKFFITILGVGNTIKILLFRLGILRQISLRIKDKNFKIANMTDYFRFWNKDIGSGVVADYANAKLEIKKDTIVFPYEGKQVTFYYDEKSKFAVINSISEEFFVKQYGDLNFKDRIVVDIGANIGDSAIYMALSGAKTVYAYEPYPYSYNEAARNIKINNLAKKIKLLNSGVGGKHDTKIIDERFHSSMSSDIKSFKSGKKIEIVTLEEIVKEFKINGGILKLDCEGAEYGIINEASDDTLNHFDEVIMEYHYGYLDIEKKLKQAGFTVNHTSPAKVYSADSDRPLQYFGMLHATKN